MLSPMSLPSMLKTGRPPCLLLAVMIVLMSCEKLVKPQVDESKARDYVGKTVLLGVSYVDEDDKLLEQKQWFGTITEVSNARGIVIDLENDTNYCALPPDLRALKPAEPGEYRLRATGEVITNPDFLTTWTRREPDPQDRSEL